MASAVVMLAILTDSEVRVERRRRPFLSRQRPSSGQRGAAGGSRFTVTFFVSRYGSRPRSANWRGSLCRVRFRAEQSANIHCGKQKTPAKPGISGTSRGSSVERLRSESNRRWRICNPLPEAVSPGNGSDSEEVTTTAITTAVADPALAQVVEAWSSLPPAVRAGILAMVEASR